MKMEEIAVLNAFWDRFDKSLEMMLDRIQKENNAQRDFMQCLIEAGAAAVVRGQRMMGDLQNEARNDFTRD